MHKYGFGASNYAQVLCVNEKEADKSLEKGEKYGMWALSSQVSGEKNNNKKRSSYHVCTYIDLNRRHTSDEMVRHIWLKLK